MLNMSEGKVSATPMGTLSFIAAQKHISLTLRPIPSDEESGIAVIPVSPGSGGEAHTTQRNMTPKTRSFCFMLLLLPIGLLTL
jgi:hypothetical protein